jgi:hypothetical protein
MPSSPPFCVCFHTLAFLITPCPLLRCGGYLLRFVATTCSCNIRSASALFPTIPSVPKLVASASARASTRPCICCAISSAPCCVARVCYPPCCYEVIIMSALCPRPPPSHTVSAQGCCVGLMATAPPSRPASTHRVVLSRFLHKRQLFTITAEAKHCVVLNNLIDMIGVPRVTDPCFYFIMRLFHQLNYGDC